MSHNNIDWPSKSRVNICHSVSFRLDISFDENWQGQKRASDYSCWWAARNRSPIWSRKGRRIRPVDWTANWQDIDEGEISIRHSYWKHWGGGGDQGRKFGLTTQMSPKGIGYGKIDRWWRCKALHEESFYLDVDSPVGHVFLTTHPINENIDDACRENIALHHWSASNFTRSVFIRDEVSPIGVARSANVSLHRDLGTTLALVLATAIRLSDLAQSGDPFR